MTAVSTLAPRMTARGIEPNRPRERFTSKPTVTSVRSSPNPYFVKPCLDFADSSRLDWTAYRNGRLPSRAPKNYRRRPVICLGSIRALVVMARSVHIGHGPLNARAVAGLRRAGSSNALVAGVRAVLAGAATCPAGHVVDTDKADVVLTATRAKRRAALAQRDARPFQARLSLCALRAGVSSRPARRRIGPHTTDSPHAAALAVLRAARDRARREWRC